MADEGYNGYTNYETWCVMLWIDNNQGMREEARMVAEAHGRDGLEELVDYWLEEALDQPTMVGDLLRHALGRVNWREITDNLLEE